MNEMTNFANPVASRRRSTRSRSASPARSGSGPGRSARSRSPRRSTTARSSRARRPVLRAHLRSDQGLRVPVRQVQAHEVQGHHLREVRRRGHRLEGPPRAHGPHRAGRAGRPHLVPEVAAEPHRPAARHDAEADSSASSISRSYVVIEPGLTPLKKFQLLTEDEYRDAQDEVWRGRLHRRHRRRGGQADADRPRPRRASARKSCARSSPPPSLSSPRKKSSSA
jgi:hypothetical protein